MAHVAARVRAHEMNRIGSKQEDAGKDEECRVPRLEPRAQVCHEAAGKVGDVEEAKQRRMNDPCRPAPSRRARSDSGSQGSRGTLQRDQSPLH